MQFHIYESDEDFPNQFRGLVEDIPNTGLQLFRHHLYTSIMPVALTLPIEEVIKIRSQTCDDALKRGDFMSYIVMHERAFRMDALHELYQSGAFQSCPAKYWKVAAYVWADAEHDESDPRWERLLQVAVPNRDAMTTLKARELLDPMPDQISVFRGVQSTSAQEARREGINGFSWSLCEDVASFFSKRFDSHRKALGLNSYILEGVVKKSEVIAFLRSRNEEEIIAPIGSVSVIRVS